MPEETTDADLVREFLNGDQKAFNTIVDKYYQRIYWHARRMTGNHYDADDVVQEVLLVMYRKLSSFGFRSSLYTWIYKITANVSINKINKSRIRKFFSLDDSEALRLENKADIVEGIENKEKLEQIQKVLMQLPVKQREVFIMRNFEQLSYEEISEITGKSVGGLKANYFHALEKVIKAMEKENEK